MQGASHRRTGAVSLLAFDGEGAAAMNVEGAAVASKMARATPPTVNVQLLAMQVVGNPGDVPLLKM